MGQNWVQEPPHPSPFLEGVWLHLLGISMGAGQVGGGRPKMDVGWESPWLGPSIGVFVLETVRVSQPSVVPGKWAFCDVHVQEDVMHPPPTPKAGGRLPWPPQPDAGCYLAVTQPKR